MKINNKSLFIDNIYFKLVLFLLLIGFVFILYTGPIWDTDIFWHLELGKYLYSNNTLMPDHSIYSWTVADPNWVYNTPIAQILLYIFYNFFGYYGLHALNYLIPVCVIIMVLYYVKLEFNIFMSVYAFLGIAICMVVFEVTVSELKPESFSFILLAAFILIYFITLSTKKNLLWLYPVLMLVWVNTHGVFIFGVVFLVVAFVLEMLSLYFSKRFKFVAKSMDPSLVKYFGICVLLSLLMLIITPYGHKWILYIINSFTDVDFMRQAKQLIAYQSIFIFGFNAKYALVFCALSFILFNLYLFLKKRVVYLPILVINIVFIYFSFLYGRSAYYYPILWVFSMVYLAKVYLIYNTEQRDNMFSFLRSTTCRAMLVLFFLVVVVYESYDKLSNQRLYGYFGYGESEYMPVSIANMLAEHNFEGQMFNNYEIGGYLMWKLYPKYKVFIDPRHGPYKKELFNEYRAFELGKNFEYFIKKYQFSFAVVKLTWINLCLEFYKSPDWKLVYFDQSAALFVRKDTNKKIQYLSFDLSADRFKNLRAYHSYAALMTAYLLMDDLENARKIMQYAKGKFYYGDFKHVIDITINKIESLQKQRNRY